MTNLRLKDTLRGSRCQNMVTNDQTNGWHNKPILRTLWSACVAQRYSTCLEMIRSWVRIPVFSSKFQMEFKKMFNIFSFEGNQKF